MTDPDEQIEVQSGDVVGYYVDYDNDNQNDKAGIQWIEGGSDVVVHYEDDLPREDIRSHYALGGLNPTECGFPISGKSAPYSLRFFNPISSYHQPYSHCSTNSYNFSFPINAWWYR